MADITYPCIFCMDDARNFDVNWIEEDLFELIFHCPTCGGEFDMACSFNSVYERKKSQVNLDE